MARLPPVLGLLSVVVVIFSLAMLAPLGVSLYLADAAGHAFGWGFLITFTGGAILWLATRRSRVELQARDGFLLVALAWTVLPLFAAVPILIFVPGIGFTHAYFEAVAGVTTTGASVLSGLDALPRSINFWRCELQWLGGMGIIVLAVAILPLLGAGGSQIMKAETPGPMKDTKLTPRITETAKGLWLVYALMTLVCMGAMKAAGMDWFDAIMHAFTTVSLGGFSSHDGSFGHFNSPAIESVAIFFMAVAGINFGTHFLAFRKVSFAPYRRDPEASLFLFLLVFSVLGIAYFLVAHQVYPDFWTALRHSAFNVVSIATTTGYASVDYNQWPIFAPVWMLFLGCFLTCSGSTGGGIKLVRARLMMHQAVRELMRIIHPRAYLPLKLSGQRVENHIIFAMLAFMIVWGSTIIVTMMLLVGSGLDVVSAVSAAVVCVTNTGPGLNEVGPTTTYASLEEFQSWVCIGAMLLGRVELFALLVVFTPAFWRK